ncbi:MAG: zf-HC2 domain-containing protein [bacterium]|nr:zf-HC2 domain-containing protein [bacterium]
MSYACRRCRPYLTAYIHNELTARARRRIDAHLDTCAQCAALYVRQRQTANELAAMRDIGAPAPERLNAIWRAVQAELSPTALHTSAQPAMMRHKPTRYSAVLVALFMVLTVPMLLNHAAAYAQIPDPPTPLLQNLWIDQQLTGERETAAYLFVAAADATHEPDRDAVEPRRGAGKTAVQTMAFQSNYAPTPGATDSP